MFTTVKLTEYAAGEPAAGTTKGIEDPEIVWFKRSKNPAMLAAGL